MKALGINGSPIKGGNVDILIQEVIKGIREEELKTGKTEVKIFYLDDLEIMPCKSCAKAPPEPDLCLYHDDMDLIYPELLSSNFFILGSPIYFDSVSAQMKLFIDRCNCFKPLSANEDGVFSFTNRKEVLSSPRKGIIILVGGKRQRFDLALSVLKGFFKWTDIEFFDQIKYSHDDWEIGGVKKDKDVLRKAFETGRKMVSEAQP
jgi:multimeric flavodoxin WrbA